MDVAAGRCKVTQTVTSGICHWSITKTGAPDNIISNDIVQGGLCGHGDGVKAQVTESTTMASEAIQAIEARRSPRRAQRVVLGLLVGALVLSLSAFGYATHSAKTWRDRANATTHELDQTRSNLGDTQAQLADVNSQLSATKSELATTTAANKQANDRIRSLANEKAQARDQNAWLKESTQMAQGVTAELNTCVKDLQDLQPYLLNFSQYNPDDVIAYARGIYSGCDLARQHSAALAARLAAS